MPNSQPLPNQSTAIAGLAGLSYLPSDCRDAEADEAAPEIANHAPGRNRAAKNGAAALLAGEFIDAIGAIWSGPRIAEYLCAPDARRHLWHACLAAEAGAFWPIDGDRAEVSYACLTSWKGKHLVAQAYGCVPAGIMNVFGRLGTVARPPNVYRALVSALSEGGPGGKFIRHRPQLPDYLVLGTARLPVFCRSISVLRALAEGDGSIASGAFMWTLQRLQVLKGEDTVTAILEHPDPERAAREARLAFPFPAPPWPGTDRLRPVSSSHELRGAGARLENCLKNASRRLDEIEAILNGISCFYAWHGEEPALVGLSRIAPLGWRVSETVGKRNLRLCGATRSAIASDLAQAPMIEPPDWSEDELLKALQ